MVGIEVQRVGQRRTDFVRRNPFTQFDLAKVSDGKYAATYAKFTQAGDYAVVVNAENADGFAVPVQTIITVGGEDSKAVAKLTGDVNGDGIQNILDIVILINLILEGA